MKQADVYRPGGTIVRRWCELCNCWVQGTREQIGARCPHCRQPLYEDPFDYQREMALRDAADAARCPEHQGNRAVGTCQRCGTYLCRFCWTRFRGKSVCVACVRRAQASNEQLPQLARAHFRQAVLAVAFGAGAWLLVLVSAVLLVAGSPGVNENLGVLGVLGMLALMPSPLPAVLGIGQGAAAIRSRGDHMILATFGMILSALYAGGAIAAIGIAVVSVIAG